MKISKLLSTVILASSFAVISSGLIAQELTGREIVEKVYNRETGNDQTSNLTMTLSNASGSQRIRKIKQFTKVVGDVEKSIMFFQSPADVKNTSFMNWSYDDGKADDQWIYLPAIKKTKRISSDSKSDYFMGSDFTYDDLGDRRLDADDHTLLREEKVNGKDCYVIESITKDDEYMYSKTIAWIDKSNFIGVKKEFYDEDEDLLKVLSIKEYQEISGLLIISNSEMKNVQKNHTTSIVLSDIEINTNIPASNFSERMMMRGI